MPLYLWIALLGTICLCQDSVSYVQDTLQQAFDAADTATAGLLSKQQCAQAISKIASELLQFSPEVSAMQEVLDNDCNALQLCRVSLTTASCLSQTT